jgi:phenylalanyl-tRNA synthetase beta chain
MNISHEWLRALVAHELSPAELRDLLTSRVVTVDEVVPLRADLAPIVIARVVEAARHPDSDHLWLTRVDAGGGEILDVVCGAPNVEAGKLYPFAPVGTVLPEGMKIERRKIRGQVSNGMLCSARELKLGESHEGILELDIDAKPGTRFLDVVPAGDSRLVLDVGANRPDLLSHLGVARELAATLGRPLVLPPIDGAPAAVPNPERRVASGHAGPAEVVVESAALAPRYMGVVVRGVKVAASPDWLVQRLAAIGARSINNVVDATNYVLHEMGQPIHAFDLARLAGSRVVVRQARAGERLVTLDGASRTLDDRIVVIADAERAQAVAGVMGGRDSEVGESTTDLFIEVATFDPAWTRASRKALGLSTDASYRFERGVDPELPPVALARVVQLVIALAGGKVEGVPIDLYSHPRPHTAVTVRVDRVRRVLGQAVTGEAIARLLRGIGFRIQTSPGAEPGRGREEVSVVVPSWRGDVAAEIDLIEEVARLYGYDAIPTEIAPFRPSTVPDAPEWAQADRLRDELVALGLHETRALPFVAGAETGYVRVENPLAETEAYLRREILETLSRRAEHNLAHMQGDVRIFEIGAVFSPGESGLPKEKLRAAALIMGARRPQHFTEPRPPMYDEWDAKALGERIAAAAEPGHDVDLVPSSAKDSLWTIMVDAKPRGIVKRVVLDAPVWASAAFGVEFTLGSVSSTYVAEPGAHDWSDSASPPPRHVRYRDLPTQPAAIFDLALLVPEDLAAERVESALRRAGGELLEQVVLFDEYRGKGVDPGYRSLAWRLTLRHAERTLRDKEVEGRRDKILKTLANELGIRPRST